MWEEEIELIDNLGLLYPKIKYYADYNKNWENSDKACWIYELCIYNLDQRMPQLEEFIRYYLIYHLWPYYKKHFNIND